MVISCDIDVPWNTAAISIIDHRASGNWYCVFVHLLLLFPLEFSSRLPFRLSNLAQMEFKRVKLAHNERNK